MNILVVEVDLLKFHFVIPIQPKPSKDRKKKKKHLTKKSCEENKERNELGKDMQGKKHLTKKASDENKERKERMEHDKDK